MIALVQDIFSFFIYTSLKITLRSGKFLDFVMSFLSNVNRIKYLIRKDVKGFS